MWELVGVCVMAFLIKAEKTKYWILRYRDLASGRWREKSTKCRVDDRLETRAAQRMEAEASRQEAQVRPDASGEFSSWVRAYLRGHYANPKSLKRYEAAWLRIVEFSHKEKIRHPSEVRYEHANAYLQWRKSRDACKHNTARLEVKFWSFLLQEAMRREYCQKNPLSLATIPRELSASKKELTPEDFAKARSAFAARTTAPWMLTAFEICAHTGCRFNEAEFGPEDVDFEAKILWLTDSKRAANDPRKKFSVPLPDPLAEHLKHVFEKRNRTTVKLVPDQNTRFNKVLKAACGATSHSLRVSFITRCHRAGLSESMAMRLVNHSTKIVHAIYSKLNIEDARQAAALVPPPV